ncbi:hypothetical protein NE237_029785 [Protea cynaroides]|uniref:Uncharacterized protein n=1 Tax=Protea cynaroides TaxID=273540 RepID=A0A9Q0JWL3_9MAGN|nr:hypothetical protein NE237_029785 [Protea cynaroides]
MDESTEKEEEEGYSPDGQALKEVPQAFETAQDASQVALSGAKDKVVEGKSSLALAHVGGHDSWWPRLWMASPRRVLKAARKLKPLETPWLRLLEGTSLRRQFGKASRARVARLLCWLYQTRPSMKPLPTSFLKLRLFMLKFQRLRRIETSSPPLLESLKTVGLVWSGN